MQKNDPKVNDYKKTKINNKTKEGIKEKIVDKIMSHIDIEDVKRYLFHTSKGNVSECKGSFNYFYRLTGMDKRKEAVREKSSDNNINDDSNDVGKVHFGVLYVVETNSEIVTPKDSEIDNGRLRTIDELEKICSSSDFAVEEWSRISLEPLKQYFSDF